MIDEKELFDKFDNLNNDKTHYKTNDDICTPMDCVKTIIDYIPDVFWNNKNIKVLDHYCGNGTSFLLSNLKTCFNASIYSCPSLLIYLLSLKLHNGNKCVLSKLLGIVLIGK